MSEQPREVEYATQRDEHTCTKQTEIAASDLVDRTKKLIEEGNVRRLIIRNEEDEVLMEVPLTAGVVGSGEVTIVAPVLTALGAFDPVRHRIQRFVSRHLYPVEAGAPGRPEGAGPL